MSGVVDPAVPRTEISWASIIGGAVAAAGLSTTLLAFGSAIGLSIVSTAPTWRDSSPWLSVLSGLYLVFVALAAFGLGGYLSGRLRARLSTTSAGEAELRDGLHGILMWGLVIIMTTILGAASIALSSTAASRDVADGSSSVVGETLIATELDELFRSDRPVVASDIAYRRSEAARILLKASSHSGVTNPDLDYLSAVVARHTGLSLNAAAQRTNQVVAAAHDALRRARQAAVVQAFMIGAALLLGLAVSWFAAREGGRERELGILPEWDWSFRRRTA